MTVLLSLPIAFRRSLTQYPAGYCPAGSLQSLPIAFRRSLTQTELAKTSLKLSGKGKLIRHIAVKDFESFPKDEIEFMIGEAVGVSEERNGELITIDRKPKSIVMSISEKKIRPQ